MKMNSWLHIKGLATELTLLALIISPAYAAVPPDSGTVLEGVKPPTVEQPLRKIPDITVEDREPETSTKSQQKIMVNKFRLSGESPLPDDELLNLIQMETGREISLGELNKLAGRLTEYLRQKGYLVAFAYVPAQNIKDGVVEIAIVPGKYGQTRISGTACFDSDRLKDMFFSARPGNVITRTELERMLLLINDITGISVKATLTPGTTNGTADLVIETADADRINGVFYSDNWGNRYTGRNRYGAQVNINNLSDAGDSLNVGGLISGSGLNNYNLGYSVLVGNDGAKFSLKHSHVGYTLGKDYESLDATGRAIVTSFDISYPLIRSRGFSLYGSTGYETKHLRDDIKSIGSYSPKHSNNWNFSLSGSAADNWLGGGSSAFSLTHSRGVLYINDATAAAIDISTAGSQGHFAKTVITFQRQQYVQDNLNLHINVTGQTAASNLDSSEKLFLGGADGVRAYPQGEASGDQGYKFTGELRWRLPGLSTNTSNVYLAAFYDYGRVIVNKDSWSGAGDNHRTLAGTGLGLLWAKDKEFSLRMDYAWKNGANEATADSDKSGRLWLQGVTYF